VAYVKNLISFPLILILLVIQFISCSSPHTEKQNLLYLGLLTQVAVNPEKTINVNGLNRSYLEYVPLSLEESSPILLAYHGSRNTATSFQKEIGTTLEHFATSNKYAIVYLSGYKGNFNDCRKKARYSAKVENIDDKAFTKAVLEKIRKETGKEFKDVYALGFSNGAHFTYRLIIEEPDLLKGAIAISANLPTEDNMDCAIVNSQNKPNLAIIQGNLDTINPTRGGFSGGNTFSNRGKILSTKETIDWFKKKYNMDSVGSFVIKSESSGRKVTRERWELGNIKILLTLQESAGHTIPQESFTYPNGMGVTYRDNSLLESSLKTVGIQ
jgi:polyhydroxybutyrate depolymerase